jgi:hypothetical protein
MKLTLALAGLAIAAYALPAAADTDFYVVQDVKTKHCRIVDQRPTTQEYTMVGPGTVYHTRVEAETAMKTVKVCTTD